MSHRGSKELSGIKIIVEQRKHFRWDTGKDAAWEIFWQRNNKPSKDSDCLLTYVHSENKSGQRF